MVSQFMWRISFCMGLISRKLYGFLLIFSAGFSSFMPHFFCLYWSPSLFLCKVFDSISSNIDEVLSSDVSRSVGKLVYWFRHPNSGAKKVLSKFYFLSCISTKLGINDLTMHLVISKWLRRQKCRKKRKKMRQNKVKVKEEIACKCVLNHLNKY